jgi:hypothetical protein
LDHCKCYYLGTESKSNSLFHDIVNMDHINNIIEQISLEMPQKKAFGILLTLSHFGHVINRKYERALSYVKGMPKVEYTDQEIIHKLFYFSKCWQVKKV